MNNDVKMSSLLDILTKSSLRGSASCASKSFITAKVPHSAAMCSGVRPSVIAKLVSAPDFKSIFVHFSPRASSMRAAI